MTARFQAAVHKSGKNRRALAVLGVLLLSACAGAPQEPGMQPEAQPAAVPDAMATVAPARPEPAPPSPRPGILKGLADNEVTRLIGLPAFRRTDDPGAIWQYRDGSCLLDLYLHADGPVYRVVHFEFRPRQRVNETIDATRCFARLAAKHTLRTSGAP